MPNERIRLDFVEFEPWKAATMVHFARYFAVSKLDGRPGQRHGTAATYDGGLVLFAYWTPSRMVVVREEREVAGG